MGKLIAVEGLDGAGKKTQSDKLLEYLKSHGKKVREVEFPDYASRSSTLVRMYLGGELGKTPDSTNAYAASTFFACDRYVSYVTGWRDFLAESDSFVIANRYTTANAYHQLAKLPRGEWDDFLSWLWDFEFSKLALPEPDCVVCLSVPPEFSLRNVEKRCAEKNIKKDIHEADGEYLKRCYDAAEYAAEKLGWHMIRCVENEAMLPVDAVFERLLADIEKSGVDLGVTE